MTTWLEDLIDEYPTKRSDKAVARLARVFSEFPQDIMRRATDEYMLNETWFPRAASLRPYVKLAEEATRGDVRYNDIAEQGRRYSDAEMLAWEQERGTMPPDDELATGGPVGWEFEILLAVVAPATERAIA